MKMRNGIVGLLLIGFLFSSIASASALEKGGFGRGDKTGFFRQLALTPEQKAKWLELNQGLEREILPLRQKNQALSLKMEDEMGKDKPDQKVIENLVKEINENQVAMQLKRINVLLKFRENLSPEQRQKMKRPLTRKK